jgi:hypothetical protein
MEPRAHLVKGPDGRDKVVLDLVDFQALVDATRETVESPALLKEVVRRLVAEVADADDDIVDLEQFLAGYDAVRGRD